MFSTTRFHGATAGCSSWTNRSPVITEQKNGELALRASEERYRAVVEGQTEFILRLDPTGILAPSSTMPTPAAIGASRGPS